MKLRWSLMHFAICFVANLTIYRSLVLLQMLYMWLLAREERGLVAVYACTVCLIQKNWI